VVYAHNWHEPASFELSGHGFSKNVPFTAGLPIEYNVSRSET
jgi:hypothetical protein